MIIDIKPTPKRLRMATILQSKYVKPCDLCGKPSVQVSCGPMIKAIYIRHQCKRHYNFGKWSEGWEL